MKINEIERIVITTLVKRNKLPMPTDETLSEIVVLARTYTGVGFFSGLEKHPLLFTGPQEGEKEAIIGAPLYVSILLNGEISTGYLCYTKGGYLSTIEGYTYGDDEWPEQILHVENVIDPVYNHEGENFKTDRGSREDE